MTPPTLASEPACPGAVRQAGAAAAPVRPLNVARVAFADVDPGTWGRLAAANPWATPFAGWGFQRAWWDAYGHGAHDDTLLLTEPGTGTPVAIAPLMHRHEVETSDLASHTAIRGASHAELTAVAPTATAVFFGASYHADYATLLAAPADLPSAAEAVVAHLAATAGPSGATGWDALDLRRIRCGDPVADELVGALIRREARAGWTVNVEREDVCPVATLGQASLDEFLGTLGKKERHEIRRKVRRAEAAGEAILAPSASPLDDLDEFIDLHQRRWGADGLFPATPGGDASRRFVRRLFEIHPSDGPLRLSFLTVAGRRIAAGITLEDADRVYYYNAGVDPEARDLSPGVVMVAKLIEGAIARGATHFDFLRGDEAYKYEWGAVDEPIQRVLVRRSV